FQPPNAPRLHWDCLQSHPDIRFYRAAPAGGNRRRPRYPQPPLNSTWLASTSPSGARGGARPIRLDSPGDDFCRVEARVDLGGEALDRAADVVADELRERRAIRILRAVHIVTLERDIADAVERGRCVVGCARFRRERPRTLEKARRRVPIPLD